MKSLLIRLALCAALGSCATYQPVAPAYYVAPLPADGAVPPYAYPYAYPYPYGYAFSPYWVDPFFVGSLSLFCCSVVHRHVHRMHGPHHWHGARGMGGRMGGMGRGGRGGRR